MRAAILVVLALVGFHWIGMRPALDAAEVLAGTPHLPATYRVGTPGTGIQPGTTLDWEVAVGSTEGPRPCLFGGSASLRQWAHGGLGGNPRIYMEACRTASPLAAAIDYLMTDATDLGRPVSIPTYDEMEAPIELPSADQSRVDCIWGTDFEECRTWVARGRYGQYLVSLMFTAPGGGTLDLVLFTKLAHSLDTLIATNLTTAGVNQP